MGKHEQIADSLTRDILVGQYRIGERLPSERDLAARFDANRGAVREAMKKLEQLGIADIQRGGARVAPLEDASLDVIGHLLAIGEVPDPKLAHQILDVIDALVMVAAESAMAHASDAELDALRALVRPLYQEQLDEEAHREARFALMGALMHASGNLVCRLIARSLMLQLVPKLAPLKVYDRPDLEAQRVYARQLEEAFGRRDVAALRSVLAAFARLNREGLDSAFAAYRSMAAKGNGQATRVTGGES